MAAEKKSEIEEGSESQVAFSARRRASKLTSG